MDPLLRFTMQFDRGREGLTSPERRQRQNDERSLVEENDPFPFVDVEDDELLFELGDRKPRIGMEYTRRYSVDTTFNVMKAALMRAERVKSKSRMMFRDLSPLLKMPVEIFLEVIEHLHPLDLYHLSKTCSALNAFLQQHSALWATTWRASVVPPCPPGFSFPQWAEFLFGPAICDVCQMYAALPDFIHLKRYCTSCMLFWCQWDELQDPVLRSLVPASTRRLGWVLPRPSAMSERWGREMERVHDMMEQLERIRDSLDYGDEGAEDAFVDFIANAREEADAAIRHADACQQWAYELFHELNEDTCERQSNALEKLKHRLLASSEGFQLSDLECFQPELSYLWFSYSLRDLKRRSFTRCIPHLLTAARSRKEARLLNEHQNLRQRRRQALETAYHAHLQTLEPRLWRDYPPLEVFLSLHDCRGVIYDHGHTEVGREKATEVVKRMERDDVFGEWLRHVKREVLATMPKSELHAAEGVDEGNVEGEDTTQNVLDDQDLKMNLATSVFTCSACLEQYRSYGFHQTGTVLFGWEEVKDHLHCGNLVAYHKASHPRGLPSSSSSQEGVDASGTSVHSTSPIDVFPDNNSMLFIPTRIRYNPSASEAVKTVLKRLDLPPDQTTVEELDMLDRRFVYEERWECVLPHTQGRDTLTWRECVMTILQYQAQHASSTSSIPITGPSADSNSIQHPGPTVMSVSDLDISWTVLTPSETMYVKQQESYLVQSYDPNLLDKSWSCAHCCMFLNSLSTQAVVLQHLQIQHNINQPNFQTDVVYLPRSEEKTPRQPVLLPPLRAFPYSHWAAVVITGGKTEDVLKMNYIGNSVIDRIYALVCATHPRFTGRTWRGVGASGRRKDMTDVVASLIYWMEVDQGLPPRADPYLRLEDDTHDDANAPGGIVEVNPLSLKVRWDVLRKWVTSLSRQGNEEQRRLERYYGRVMGQRDWCLSVRQAEELAKALIHDHSGRHFGDDEVGWVSCIWNARVMMMGLCGALGMWFVLAYS